jgi:prephenate dehydratase
MVQSKSQEILRVAFSGAAGAFAEEALFRLWPDATPVPTRTMADAAAAVLRGDAHAGVLPVENTVAGGVVAAYDALVSAPGLHAIRETILEIHLCLLALDGATLENVEVVESHPMALAQCAQFLSRFPEMRQIPASDTAGAARAVAGSGDPRRGALASAHAAARYGLTMLAEDVEDRHDNQTRFLAVALSPAVLEADIPARTSLIFTTRNEPGGLIRTLEPIAHHGLNLSKLESRPTGEPWTYRFFADIDHQAGDPRLDSALAAMAQSTLTCRVLGTYARAR